MNYNKAPGVEVIQGLLDRIMQLVEVPYSKTGPGYYLKEAQGNNIIHSIVMCQHTHPTKGYNIACIKVDSCLLTSGMITTFYLTRAQVALARSDLIS